MPTNEVIGAHYTRGIFGGRIAHRVYRFPHYTDEYRDSARTADHEVALQELERTRPRRLKGVSARSKYG
jgi:hypothetical protein